MEAHSCIQRIKSVISPSVDAIYDAVCEVSPDDADATNASFTDRFSELLRQKELLRVSLNAFGIKCAVQDASSYFKYSLPASRVWACCTAKHAVHEYLCPGISLLLSGLESSSALDIKQAFIFLDTGTTMLQALSGSLDIKKNNPKSTKLDLCKSEMKILIAWIGKVNAQMR